MTLKEYALFSPPEALAAKSHRDWTKKEAQSYFDWLMVCLEARVAGLLRTLGLEHAEGADARSLVAKASERAVQALRDPACSKSRADGTPALTNIGYSLAADVGLLVASQVCRTVGDKVRWEIVRKPKNDVSYNLPVLVGFGWVTYDPVGVSIADAVAVLSGRCSSDAWVKVFDSCVADAGK